MNVYRKPLDYVCSTLSLHRIMTGQYCFCHRYLNENTCRIVITVISCRAVETSAFSLY